MWMGWLIGIIAYSLTVLLIFVTPKEDYGLHVEVVDEPDVDKSQETLPLIATDGSACSEEVGDKFRGGRV